MKKYRFSKGFYIAFIAVLLCFSLIVLVSVQLIRFYIRDGYLEKDSKTFLLIFFIVGLSWTYTTYQMIKQKYMIKTPLAYDEEGVHQVLIGGIFLAFIIIIPIKFIPFEHLYFSGIKVRVKKEYLKTYPLMTRFILMIKGAHLFVMYAKLDKEFYEHIELPFNMKESTTK